MMSKERVRNLYGSADGTWLFVESPLDVVPPAAINIGAPGTSPHPGAIRELRYLGPPHDVFTTLCADVEAMPVVGLRGRTGKVPVQQALGDMFGVSQQSVSRYIEGTSEPDLSDDQWRELVRASYDPGRVVSVVHHVVIRRANQNDESGPHPER
jgi:hypothetical protein